MHIPNNRSEFSEIIYPNTAKFILLILLTSVLIAGCVWGYQPDDENTRIKNILWVAGGVIFCIGVLVFLFVLVTRRPRIILDKTALTRLSFFNTQTWNWASLAPFSVSIQELSTFSSRLPFFKPGGSLTHLYLCAYTQRHSEILSQNNDEVTPDYLKGDVVLPLQYYALNLEEAEELAGRFNNLRLGAKENRTSAMPLNSETEYTDLKTKIRRKKLFYYTVVTGSILFTAYFYFEKPVSFYISKYM